MKFWQLNPFVEVTRPPGSYHLHMVVKSKTEKARNNFIFLPIVLIHSPMRAGSFLFMH
jgi:hypothetical protein